MSWLLQDWPTMLLFIIALGMMIFANRKDRGVPPLTIYLAVIIMMTGHDLAHHSISIVTK